jgi:hypothetical protein
MKLLVALALLPQLFTNLPPVDPNAKMPPAMALCANATADARRCPDVEYGRTFELQGVLESAELIQGDVILHMHAEKTAPSEARTGEWIIRAPGYVYTQRAKVLKPGRDVIALVWLFKDVDCTAGCKAQAHGLESPCTDKIIFGTNGPKPPPCDDIEAQPPNWNVPG